MAVATQSKTWKRGPFKIQMFTKGVPSHLDSVEGYARGIWGIHRAKGPVRHPWIITHLPSGLAAFNARTLAVARAFASLLVARYGEDIFGRFARGEQTKQDEKVWAEIKGLLSDNPSVSR